MSLKYNTIDGQHHFEGYMIITCSPRATRRPVMKCPVLSLCLYATPRLAGASLYSLITPSSSPLSDALPLPPVLPSFLARECLISRAEAAAELRAGGRFLWERKKEGKVSSAVQLWLALQRSAPRCLPLPCGFWTGSFRSTRPW